MERLVINGLFDVEKYGDLWKVICREDRISTICGAFSILYLRNIHRSLLIDAGFIRHEKEMRQVFERFGQEFGVGLEGVIAVLCTHLHADHLGNPEIFPKATYYAHKEAIDLLHENPTVALYKHFQYQNTHSLLTMSNEVEDLAKIIKGLGKQRESWIQPLEKCPYAERGLLVHFISGYPGLRWGETPGHAAGHCSFVLHLPYGRNVSNRGNLSHYRHIFLGDCLTEDQSPDAQGINPGRRWVKLLGLKRLKKTYSVHPSHSLQNSLQ
jgi:glyoxylase-like metal-dependent hydrolase (beta-lactamase superfamily II)